MLLGKGGYIDKKSRASLRVEKQPYQVPPANCMLRNADHDQFPCLEIHLMFINHLYLEYNLFKIKKNCLEGSSAFKILTGKPTGNRSLGRSRRRWEYNIRMHLKQISINTRN